MGVLSTLWKEIDGYNLNGIHYIWQLLHDSPNRQIKMTAKYSGHKVFIIFVAFPHHVQVLSGSEVQAYLYLYWLLITPSNAYIHWYWHLPFYSRVVNDKVLMPEFK